MPAGLLAVAALLLNALVYGLLWWPFRELQAQGLHPLWATALVYLIGLAGLLILYPRSWPALLRHPMLYLLVLAAGLTNVGFNWSVTVGDVVRAVLLFYLMPAWVVLLAWPLLGERPTAASLLRLALALAGVVLVLQTPGALWPVPESLADWLALMGGFCFALTNVLLRKLHDTPEEARMLALFLGGAVMSLAVAGLGLQFGVVSGISLSGTGWLPLALALSLALLVGNMGLQYGAARLSAGTTSIIMLSEVVVASLSSVWLGAGQLSAQTLAGGALILLASILAVLPVGPMDGAPQASSKVQKSHPFNRATFMTSVYDFQTKQINGQPLSLNEFSGRVLLIVNTASACGFTPQFAGLEALHKSHGQGGLVVMGFPCNQFGGQDPASNDKIAEFCQLNYGVSFLMMAKVEVNGAAADPLYQWLCAEAPGLLGTRAVKWNFTKFLVGRDGQVLKRYAPTDTPASLLQDIEAALAA